MRRPGSYKPGDEMQIEDLPPDLAPIPYGAGDEDIEAIRTCLYLNFGNVKLAARALGSTAGAIARKVEGDPSLRADRDAARRMIVDLAEANIVEQLSDTGSVDRRDEAAKFVLTSLGKSLGWGAPATSAAGF